MDVFKAGNGCISKEKHDRIIESLQEILLNENLSINLAKELLEELKRKIDDIPFKKIAEHSANYQND